MASDATERTDGTEGTDTRPCEICGRPIEAIRIEVIPATRLCQEHGQMFRKFGGEFIVRSREDKTSKENSLKKNYAGVTTKLTRNEAAVAKVRREYEAVKTAKT